MLIPPLPSLPPQKKMKVNKNRKQKKTGSNRLDKQKVYEWKETINNKKHN